jgi:hypothetical protein
VYGLLVSYMQVTDTKLQEETIIFNGWVTQWQVWLSEIEENHFQWVTGPSTGTLPSVGNTQSSLDEWNIQTYKYHHLVCMRVVVKNLFAKPCTVETSVFVCFAVLMAHASTFKLKPSLHLRKMDVWTTADWHIHAQLWQWEDKGLCRWRIVWQMKAMGKRGVSPLVNLRLQT